MNKKSILIVDDDAELREYMASALSALGYNIVTAEDGEEGLKCFRENSIDLVITDIYMPKMDGLELIQTLRKIAPEVKILATSGDNRDYSHDALDWAEAAGAFEILEKPFEHDQFIDMIKTIIVASE